MKTIGENRDMDLLGSSSLVHTPIGTGPFTDLGLGLDHLEHHHVHHHQPGPHHYNPHIYHPAYTAPNQPLHPQRPFTPVTSQSGSSSLPNNYSPGAVSSTSLKIKSGMIKFTHQLLVDQIGVTLRSI